MRRNAALFVLVSLLSGFGGMAMTLAGGIWIFDLTGRAGLAALTGLCLYAPNLAAPWLGALVDRLPRRPLLIGVETLLGAAMLTLLLVRSAGTIWLIFAVLLVRGLCLVLNDAAESALLPAALPPAVLGDVNGWRTSAGEGMKLVAPLVGAGLYAWQGPVPVVLTCTVLTWLSATCYARLRLAAPAPEARPRDRALAAEIWAGWVALFGDWSVRVPVLTAAAAIALSGLTNAAVIDRVVHGLGLAATSLGLLSAAQGCGSIVGGLVAGRVLSRVGVARTAAIGAVLFGAGCLCWCVSWLPVTLAGSALAGIGLPWALIAGVTAVQTGTPEHLLGRVAASATMVMFGPVGITIPLGAAAVHAGGRPVLLVAAVLSMVVAATAGRVTRRRYAAALAKALGEG